MEKLSMFERIDIINNFGVNLDTATIYIAGEIDGGLNISIRMKIDMILQYKKGIEQPCKEINFIVASPGGDAFSILALVDMYEDFKKQGILINILIEGICYSATTFVCACATGKRRASKNSRFLVHELQIKGGDGTHTQSKSFGHEVDELNEQILNIYTQLHVKKLFTDKVPTDKEYTKVYKDWEKKCQSETYFSAEKAIEYGFIDEIV